MGKKYFKRRKLLCIPEELRKKILSDIALYTKAGSTRAAEDIFVNAGINTDKPRIEV